MLCVRGCMIEKSLKKSFVKRYRMIRSSKIMMPPLDAYDTYCSFFCMDDIIRSCLWGSIGVCFGGHLQSV